MIGVVVPDLVTHYYSAVLDGIEDKAREAGYSVICANTHESCEDEVRAIDNFINLHVEGIIASLSQNTTDYTHFEEIAKMGIPLVFFGRTCLTDKFSCVIANGDIAAQEATQHLIAGASPLSADRTTWTWCGAVSMAIWRHCARTVFRLTGNW